LRQISFTLLAVMFMVLVTNAQNYRLWEKSRAAGNYPSYLTAAVGGANERGFAYGKVGGNDRVYIVSRNGGNKIIVINAATGDSVGALNTTGITGGTFAINDIDVTSDGIIFAANMSQGIATDSLFKVYKWTDESATPTTVIQLVKKSTFRLGDKITVTGSTADNSVTIWAATASKDTVVKFKTTDNGATFTPTYIKMSNGASATGASPSVAPIGDGSTGFFVKSSSKAAIHFDANGTKVDSIPTTIGASGSTAIRYFEYQSRKFVLLYNYGASATTENMTLLDVTSSVLAAKTIFKTTSMWLSGAATNANGTGDLAVQKKDDGSYVLYVFGTSMGMSSYLLANTFSIKNAKAETASSYVPDLLGVPVTVTGEVATANLSSSAAKSRYYLFDGSAGIAVSLDKQLSTTLSLGDTVTVKGRIAQFRGLTQIVPFDSIVSATGSISVPKTGTVPAAIVITPASLKSESYEGALVKIKNLKRLSTSAAWPTTTDSTNITLGTLTDSLSLAILTATNIGSNSEPVWEQNITGIASQYSSSDTAVTDGYELIPRSISDFATTPGGLASIKVIPQGFYNSAGYLNCVDTVLVLLANASSPYAIVDSAYAKLDSSTYTAATALANANSGYYYVVVKHRNSVETWSSQTFAYVKGDTITYNFTDSLIRAYGSNLIQVSSSPELYGIYSGDVNQDGYVDPLDLSLVDQDSYNYVAGTGLATDVNGDHYVDPLDLSLVDQNSYNYVGVQKPNADAGAAAKSRALARDYNSVLRKHKK
jgi:DNA/RNA endonuclease YhcR with UshA esterase domain